MIEPFFFGPKQLFGIYHPSQDAQSQKLVVICPPLFDEYRRSYRALADFSLACTEKGFHVLRFDYIGTGDSYGDLSEVNSTDEWVDNIDQAIDEGCALSGAEDVILVAVRFGATLAANCKHPSVVRRVLWDPLASGRDYCVWLEQVDEWQREHHKNIAKIVGGKFTESDGQQFFLNTRLRQSMAALQFQSGLSGTKIVFSQQTTNTIFSGDDSSLLNDNYEWPAFDEGLIRPIKAFSQLLEYL